MFLLAKYLHQLKDPQSLPNLTDVRFFSPFCFFYRKYNYSQPVRTRPSDTRLQNSTVRKRNAKISVFQRQMEISWHGKSVFKVQSTKLS